MKAFLLSLAVIFFAGCVSAPLSSGTGRATVQAVTGHAELSRDGATFSRAQRGETVAAGWVARTGVDGRIDFTLQPHGGVFTLHPYSTVRFEQLGAAHDADVVAVLDLTRGRVTGDTLKLPSNTKIVVKTPNGMHEIR